jgi:hypothetical protein
MALEAAKAIPQGVQYRYGQFCPWETELGCSRWRGTCLADGEFRRRAKDQQEATRRTLSRVESAGAE